MTLEIGGDAVAVEQRVLHVEQEDNFVCGHGKGNLLALERGLQCQIAGISATGNDFSQPATRTSAPRRRIFLDSMI